MLHPDLTYRYSSTLPSFIFILPFRGFPGGSVVKNLPAMQETWSPGWEDSLEEEMAIQSSILTWRIPRTEEPGGLQSMGSQRAWLSTAHTHTHTHTHTNTDISDQIRSDAQSCLTLCDTDIQFPSISLFLPFFQQIFIEHALGIYIWITDRLPLQMIDR